MNVTVPTVPTGIDDAANAGWTYHRNGVSGCGFYAKVENRALLVAWEVYDEATEDYAYPVAATIPLPVLDGFAGRPPVGTAHERLLRRTRSVVRHVVDTADGNLRLYVFDLAGEPGDLEGRILVVSDLIEGEELRVAAFVLGEVLSGDASTTLRGDTLHDVAVYTAAYNGDES
jgi:hypothetical protein